MAASRKRRTRTTNRVMRDVLIPSDTQDPQPQVQSIKQELPVTEPVDTNESKKSNYIELIRELPAIKAVLNELKTQEKVLRVDKSAVAELERYCSTKGLIPNVLSADNHETVDLAQQGLQELQARLDRVAAIHLGVRKIQRALQKLETMARHELAVNGHITAKTTKPSADQLLSLAIPELQVHQDAWDTFSRICRDVQDHIGSAKEVIRIQMKLDENLHWAQRHGA